MPNCYVPIRYSVIGGVSAAILFETVKYAFGYYVKAVPTYEAVYGALAVLPIFLIWIYISWIVVLLGAQLTYSLSTFRLTDKNVQPDRDWDLVDVCLVLAHMWHAQRAGHGLTLEQLGALEPDLAVEHIIEILEALQGDNWLLDKEAEGEWILTRDLSEQNLLDPVLLDARPSARRQCITDSAQRNGTVPADDFQSLSKFRTGDTVSADQAAAARD
ncbi:MAG: YihY family inner membrane protein [Gammaproteobacteria bacterium]|nr:YihY family inner membrane protein [Gammaproteobacteria bacterium]